MKYNKYIILACIISFICGGLNAQAKKEVGVFVGGGLSSLNYKGVSDNLSNRTGVAIGGTYTYFLTDNLGVKSGLELSYHHAKTKPQTIVGSISSVDSEGEAFDYNYSIGGYIETQKVYFLNIPLMLHFETNRANSITNFYASGGVKIGLPISSKYKSQISSIKTEGYYSNTNVVYDDLLFAGLDIFSNQRETGKIKSNIQVMASLECGVKNRIGEKLFIYSGLYCDYGLNNLTKKNKTFLEYDAYAPRSIEANSILNSKITNSNGTSSFVHSVNAISLGVKVNLSFEL